MSFYAGSILHASWCKHTTDETKILGIWAEDGATYEITVPHQLRDTIVGVQNKLAANYANVVKLEFELEQAKLILKNLGIDD